MTEPPVPSTPLPASAATLALRLIVPSGSANVAGVDVYAYPAGGPTPPASPAGTFAVSAASPNCAQQSNGRLCTFLMPVPTGALTLHVELWDTAPSGGTQTGNRLGSTELSMGVAANTTASMNVISAATPASLTMSVTPTSAPAPGTTISVSLNAQDASGNSIAVDYPVAIFAPAGTIATSGTPPPNPPPIFAPDGVQALTNGSAAFTYTGGAINAMTVAALAGTFSQTAQVLPYVQAANPSCPIAYPNGGTLSTLAQNPFNNGMSSGAGFFTQFTINGFSDRAQLDTGSELFILQKQDVAGASPAQAVGPAEAGFEQLGSDTNAYYGHYYLARVTLSTFNPPVVTVPMKVMVEDVACTNGCYNLMGIGIGRPASTPNPQYGVTYKSPLMNALLQSQSIVESTRTVAGYTATASGFTAGLGAGNTSHFGPANFQTLAPFAGRFNDWNGPQGCGILTTTGGVSACQPALLLLDTGLPHMFLQGFSYPPGTFTTMTVQIPSTPTNALTPIYTPPIYTYSFAVNASPPPAPTPVPPIPPWVEQEYQNVNIGTPTLNTGVQLLGGLDYLYDNVCGRAGFHPTGP